MNLSSQVRVLLVCGGHRDEILHCWSDLQSSLISPLPLELIQHFFDPPDAALLPILDLLDRIRGGYFQLVCVVPPNATWTSQLRSRRSPFGLEDLDPEAAQHVLHANACCECSAWIAKHSVICRQSRLILPFPEDLDGHDVDGPAVIWSCHEYQMLEGLHEAERGAARLCQLSSADHRGPWGSSPTFPTCWIDCRRDGRLCSSLTQGWCTKVHFQSPAAVRLRERSGVRRSSELGRRDLDGQSIWAALSTGLGVRRYSFCPKGWGYCVTARRTHPVFASGVLFVNPSFLFVSGLSVRLLRVLVIGWLRSSHSASRRRLFTRVEVLGQPSPGRVAGLLSHRFGRLLLYLEVDNRFCFSLRWSSGAVRSRYSGARVPEVGAGILPHEVGFGCTEQFRTSWVSRARLVPGVSGPVSPLSPCSSLLVSVPSAVPAKRFVPPGSGPALLSRSSDLVVFPRVCPETVSPGVTAGAHIADHRQTPRTCWLWNFTLFVNAVSERRWYEFPEESCEFTSDEEGHCIAGQIADSTAVASAPGL